MAKKTDSNAEKESKWASIREEILKWIIKSIPVLVGIILVYLIFTTFFELRVNINLKTLNEHIDLKCPTNIKIFGILRTNQRSGIVKYQLVDELNQNDALTGELSFRVNANDTICFLDTIPLFIENKDNIENRKVRIVLKAKVLYEDFFAKLLPETLKDHFINKEYTSQPINLYCIKEEEDMAFVEGGYKKIKKTRINVKSFHIDVDEVSCWSYSQFVKENPKCGRMPFQENFRIANMNDVFYPVCGVAWENAKCYCESIGKQLPTVDQWEYAANGGKFYATKESAIVDADDNEENGWEFGRLNENSLGIKGMTSNAAEWCIDAERQNPKLKAIKGLQRFLIEYNNSDTKYIDQNSELFRKTGFRCIKSINHE